MKRAWLPFSLLLTAAPTDGGGGAAVASGHPNAETDSDDGDAGDDLGIADAVALLENIPDALRAQIAAKEKPAAKPATDAAPAAAKPPTPTSPAASATPVTEPTWTDAQTAWFAERAAATTPEAIAAIDAKAPEFTDEQRAYLEAQPPAAAGDSAPQAPEFTTPEQKAWVDKQTAQLAAAKKVADDATAKISELETKVQELAATPPAVTGNVHPLALVDDVAKIDEYEAQLEEFVIWGKANFDGTAEVPAQNGQPAVRAYSAQEIRAAVAKREQELRKTIPAARQALATRQAQTEAAKKIYPNAFDAKTPEGQQTAALLRQYPILKVIFPNFHVIAGDAMRGEKLRLAEAAKAKLPAGKLPVPPRPGFKIPPRASGGSRATPPAKGKTEPTAEQYQTALAKAGGNDLAALTALMGG